MTTANIDKINLTAELHKVVLNLFGDPYIIETISNHIYDYHGNDIKKFVYDQGRTCFELTVPMEEVESTVNSIRELFSNIFMDTLTNPAYTYFFSQYPVIEEIRQKHLTEICDLLKNCITILIIPIIPDANTGRAEEYNVIIRINLHN